MAPGVLSLVPGRTIWIEYPLRNALPAVQIGPVALEIERLRLGVSPDHPMDWSR